MKKRDVLSGLCGVLVIVGILFTALWVKFLVTPLITDAYGYQYTVRPGSAIKTVIQDLYSKNIIHNRFFFHLLVRWRGDGQALKAGEYFFSKGTTPSKMLNQMVAAKGLVYHAFTIIPGWDFNDLRAAILEADRLRHTLQNVSDQEVMTHLGRRGEWPEGQFFPDTYYFAEGISDIALLKRAAETMQSKLNTAWDARAANLPYKNSYEVLIAASLIEKEAYLNEERPMIAGVLMNRLRKDMLLQIDPTVIYGMGSRYSGKIRKEDLLENNPYNTYVNKGLPPTPIAMPSLESLMAVVHPQQNDYFYYVARGDGSHQFSSTYIQHQTAIVEMNKGNPWFFNTELLRHNLLAVLSSRF